MAAPEILLHLEGVFKRRPEQNFELEVEELVVRRGSRLAITGPSGCGKSTCIDVLALALRPTSATRFIFVEPGNGRVHDVPAVWRDDHDRLALLRARYFGYVLQSGGLLPFLTVRENIALPQRLAEVWEPGRIERLGEALAIGELLDRNPDKLSVGQRQRVAIARALSHNPLVVLADEPTSSLDPQTGARVMDLLLDQVEHMGCGLVLVSHDPDRQAERGLQTLDATMASVEGVARTSFTSAAGQNAANQVAAYHGERLRDAASGTG
jgi:putative ABC transport system ATP-binding protein